jgi:aerobic-type carbon monoxide dehydrogenase small subunit (CoxS/CutS family)
MATLTLTVNGRAQTVDVDPTTPLLYVRSDDLTLCGSHVGTRQPCVRNGPLGSLPKRIWGESIR